MRGGGGGGARRRAGGGARPNRGRESPQTGPPDVARRGPACYYTAEVEIYTVECFQIASRSIPTVPSSRCDGTVHLTAVPGNPMSVGRGAAGGAPEETPRRRRSPPPPPT